MFAHSIQRFLTFYKKLEKKEAIAYRQFLKNMPGSGEAALEVLDYIKKQPEGWEPPDPGVICAKLYGQNTEGGRTKVQNALSDLNLQMPKFLLYRKATDKSLESRWIWLAVLRDLDMRPEFSTEIQQMYSEILAGQRINDLDYWKCLSVGQWRLSSLGPSEMEDYADVLPRFNNDLDLYYALAKLKTACLWANARNLQSVDSELEHLVEPDAFINHPAWAKDPLILLYGEVYRLITTKQEEQYSEIIKLLNRYSSAIDQAELHLMMRYLFNFANKRIKNGDEEYWESINDLHKFSHQRNIFPRDGLFPANHFINIVATACNTGDVEWAKEFMASYAAQLPDSVQEDTILLASATIAFEQKDFHRVLNDLEQKSFKNDYDNIRARALILKSMYECEKKGKRIESYCDSFERYLRNQRRDAPKDSVDATKNTVLIIRKLLAGNLSADQLKSAIEQTKPLYFKTWLLEKVARYPD